MLCSSPPVKSGPNWLDRLRSNKGFPLAENLTLDLFLTDQNPSDSPIPSSSYSPHSNPDSTRTHHHFDPNFQPRDRPSSSLPQNGNPEPYGIITGILSELFHMGSDGSSQSSKFSGKKLPRKQCNPKICSISRADNDMDEKNICCVQKEENTLSSNSDNSLKGAKCNGGLDRELKGQNVGGKVEEEDVEEEKGEKELIGYSKSEVTVIDTSGDVWKSDKLVFRRKNVWKVKEKKGKSRSYGRKKRKPASECNGVSDMIASGSKIAKVWGSEECVQFDTQQDRGKESLKPLNKAHNSQYRPGPEMSVNATDSGIYVKENVGPEKRPPGDSSKRS